MYETPPIGQIKQYCEEEIAKVWDEVLRFENPQNYYVDLSQKLWDVKHELLSRGSKL